MNFLEKVFLSLVAFGFVFIQVSNAQAPSITWQKSLGGSLEDGANASQQTTDGGYIVAGFTHSNDGDVLGIHPSPAGPTQTVDVWVVKLNSLGTIEWQKCLGGSYTEQALSIQQTTDGGYIVAGYTWSDDGDVSGRHGYTDYWIVKLNFLGTIEWQKCFGGNMYESPYLIQQTSDEGYIIAGYATSTSPWGGSNVTGNHGDQDYWVVKLDSNGSIEWEKCLGGSNYDFAQSVQQTADGGYIVAGTAYSNDYDVTGNHGGSGDAWIVKLDSSGNIAWQKCLGGSDSDAATSIQQTTDGGYIVAGFTYSNDGDVSGKHGSSDAWIVKLDLSGNIVWQKCLGGSNVEQAYSIRQTTDDGYIVAGWSNSNDGDVSGNHGNGDYWIVKLDSNGNIEWQKCLGGSGADDYAYSIQQTTDGGYIVAGTAYSSGCDITGAHGSGDAWVVKLDVVTGIKNPLYDNGKILVHPNPTSGLFNIMGLNNVADATVVITNSVGQIIYKNKLDASNASVDLSNHPKGLYSLRISGKDINTGQGVVKTEQIVLQ